jgi:hypothetical protein
MDQLTSFEKDVLSGKICPYCNCETQKVTDKEIYGLQSNYNKSFIQCIQNSDHYVGTFSNGKSLGRLADSELRKLKRDGHAVFDKLWQGEEATFNARDHAYIWLSRKMRLSMDLTHFAMFNNEQCIQSIQIVNAFLKLPKWLRILIK